MWAEDHAGDLLRPLGRRWRHAQAVAETARELASGLTPEDADVLVAAAYLHDIGYAPELAVTGFHPLDGARHLRSLGHERLAGFVAHHTRADHEARLRGLESALAEFDDEDSIVSAALAYCDLTTGPIGQADDAGAATHRCRGPLRRGKPSHPWSSSGVARADGRRRTSGDASAPTRRGSCSSAQVGLGALLQVVLDPETNRRVDLHVLELVRAEVADLARLVARCQLAAETPAGEADRELLADLAV